MSVKPGQLLSHYKLIYKIGEGGMGVVWKAVDTTLDREVAIKILPEPFAADSDRAARFEREAKLLASLNHTNIAMIHGLHQAAGTAFIAMELVPGETLAERVTRGPVPLDEALELGRQITQALEAAHERGVIHRDLKPANIKLRDDGTLKVLDFGLAKAFAPEPASSDPATSPTVTSGGTLAGMIMGTPAYMSPEQARGKAVDKRADIWAFGCVLFELLTGKRAFAGSTPSDTLAAVLKVEPDWNSLPNETPPRIRELLRRCLHKDTRKRLRDIGEAQIAIEELDASEHINAKAAQRFSWVGWLPLASAVLLPVCVGIGFWISKWFEPTPPQPPTRLSVSLPQHQQLVIGHAFSLAVSPDGSRLVYAAASPPGSSPQLYLRELDSFEAVPIPGTAGALSPFFSPNGEWLGFFMEGKLFKVALAGGAPKEICHVGQVVPGASWGADDTIIYVNSPDSGLLRVPATGGSPEKLTTPDYANGETGHGWPQVLPDGQSVLFNVGSVEGSSIAVLSLRSGEWRTLGKGLGGARYLPTGHMVYAQPEGLVVVPFDLERLETNGAAVLVLEEIYTVPGLHGFGLAAFAVSDTGLLAYLSGDATAGENRLVWVDRDGRSRPLPSEPGSYEWPQLSPDGKRIAVTDRTPEGTIDIWVLDPEREARSRLTLEGMSIIPRWMPDGKRIAFGSTREGSGVVRIYSKAADGSGEVERLLEGPHPRFPSSWSPNGKLLAITEWHPDSMRDVWMLSLAGQPETTPIVATQFDEHSAIFSPDGNWLAYVSDESGRTEIYVQSYPVGRGRWLISAGGGKEPIWSASGRELFYRNANALLSVPIQTEPDFQAGTPRLLFDRPLKTGIYDSPSYDVSPDGQQFIMIERDLETAPNQLKVVLNWK